MNFNAEILPPHVLAFALERQIETACERRKALRPMRSKAACKGHETRKGRA